MQTRRELGKQYYHEKESGMKLFTDVRIGRRLGIGFGITLCLMVVIVITGMIYISSLSKGLERIVIVNNGKVRCANDIRIAFADINSLVGEIVTGSDSAAREAAKKKISELRAKCTQSVEALEALEINDEGKRLISTLKEEAARGEAATDSVIELGMSGNGSEAIAKYGEITKTAGGYCEAADAVARWNEGRTKFRHEEAKRNTFVAHMVFLVLGIVTLLAGTTLSRAITRSITIPIGRSSAQIDLMAKGDFSNPVSEHALKRRDEMGIFARSMDAMNTNLKQILKEVTASAANVASASTQLTMSVEKLSKGATEQVERATVAATGSEEMSQASNDTARNSTQVATLASEAVSGAEEGRKVVDKSIEEVNLIAETVETALGFVRELGEQSAKIGDIVTVINDIADQTNLLALNAAIEAARAGEQGRGFAVVADEVRKLAERTSTSTTEIANMINVIREGVRKTVVSMDTAKDKVSAGVEYSSQVSIALEGIIESINHLYGGIHQIATATEEMTATTDEIARDINQISVVTQETFSSSGEISQAAAGLSDLSRHLEGAVQNFKV